MLLVQKQTKIILTDEQRIRKIMCISLSMILIIKPKNIALYDIEQSKQIMSSSISDWICNGNKIADENTSILQVTFHPKIYKLYILLSKKEKDKHQNWVFVEIKLQGNKFINPNVLMEYQKSLTKYKEMELKPRIILMPKSDHIILLRQFYNDSLVVVFKNSQQFFDFFINQQNMSQFDKTHQLVSYRSSFANKINFYLFNIHDQVQNFLSKQYIINLEKGGVVLSIKKIDQNQYLTNEKFISQFDGKKCIMNYKDSFSAVIAVNWRNKSFSYLIYNSAANHIINEVIQPNSRLDSMIFSIFLVNNLKICSLQLKGNRQVLVYEKFVLKKQLPAIQNKQQQKNKQIQQYQVSQQMQEWDTFWIDNKNFVILNYSQPFSKQNEIKCKLYRNVNRQQLLVQIINQIGISQNLLQCIVEMTQQQ